MISISISIITRNNYKSHQNKYYFINICNIINSVKANIIQRWWGYLYIIVY